MSIDTTISEGEVFAVHSLSKERKLLYHFLVTKLRPSGDGRTIVTGIKSYDNMLSWPFDQPDSFTATGMLMGLIDGWLVRIPPGKVSLAKFGI